MKKTKKKLRIKGLLFFLLIIYLIAMIGYYFLTLPIKNIIVKNNKLLNDSDIINVAKIDNKTSLLKTSSYSLKKKIKTLPLVHDVKISKNIFGTITITIEENKVLFYNSFNNKLILSDKTTIEDDNKYLGIPTLVNYVPSDVYNKLINKLSKVDENIIAMISEIEYSPDTYENVVIDNERFLFRMNDGNIVYINNANMEKISKYASILASVGTGGTLYLDSNNDNYIFKTTQEELNEQIPQEDNNEN